MARRLGCHRTRRLCSLGRSECANVEIDLDTGLRGRRGAAIEALCQEVTGAEAALVVNNCAAATVLTLQTIAAGRQVVISRGPLIETAPRFCRAFKRAAR